MIAAWCALVLGPLVGLAIVFVSVEVSAAVWGWPTDASETSGLWEILPRIGGVWDIVSPLVFGLAWYADAAVRRWVFRRLAWAELSLSAALVSTVVAPGLWLIDPAPGLHTSGHGVWLWPLIVGPVFLRWRSHRSDAGRRLRPRIWVTAALCLLTVAGVACGVVLAGQAHLTPPLYASIGLSRSGDGGYAVRSAQPLPLETLVGHRSLPLTAYYDFTLGNSSPIPITITGASATPTGPVIAVREIKFLSGLGNAGGRARSSIALKRDEDIHVRVVLQLRACPAHSGGARSSIPRIALHYTALGRPGTTTLVPSSRLTLSCP